MLVPALLYAFHTSTDDILSSSHLFDHPGPYFSYAILLLYTISLPQDWQRRKTIVHTLLPSLPDEAVT